MLSEFFPASFGDGCQSPAPAATLIFLTSLRGVAILMVVFFHAFYFNPKAPGPVIIIGRLMETGWMGVQIFYCFPVS